METYRQAVARAKREYLTELLAYCDGDVPRAARLGRVHRSQIYKLVPEVVRATGPRKVIELFGRKLGARECDLSRAPLARRFGR